MNETLILAVIFETTYIQLNNTNSVDVCLFEQPENQSLSFKLDECEFIIMLIIYCDKLYTE
ncbi:hypothetical protein DERP_001133 [Dermatophagoides pteronyssinus]|uniref:Uncharacterized protein n=1 Tax=Dermatophagoides pteronyssinus TaxID=6956 RepID=A0ABQ8JE39_DERPT|nr:hypothetical protein DERP_001133 [Dermatophagoides pteronyssinus]